MRFRRLALCRIRLPSVYLPDDSAADLHRRPLSELEPKKSNAGHTACPASSSCGAALGVSLHNGRGRRRNMRSIPVHS